MRTPVLDHGYLEVIEYWGSDERIVEAARMSTQKGFLGWGPFDTGPCGVCYRKPGRCWNCHYGAAEHDCHHCNGTGRTTRPGDEKLLRYLMQNRHETPFEMAGMVIEVQAPIMVFREWHRHRTQCLAGGTKLHFDLPGGIERRGTQKYTLTIREVVERFQPTVRLDRPNRQMNAYGPRDRIQNMRLRCVDEDTLAVTHTTIVDAWESGMKPVFDVEIESGEVVRCSADHRFFTPIGWRCLRELVPHVESGSWGGASFSAGPSVYSVKGAPAATVDFEVPPIESEERWKPVLGWESWYEVSNMGRVRRIAPNHGAILGRCKKLSPDKAGYLCVSLNRPGVQERLSVHRLVLEAFVGLAPDGHECCHTDGNAMNNWLSNLRWGTPQDNADDRIRHGRVPSLKTFERRIVSVRPVGQEMTYDIEVADPWHNFIADGFVVHNSYNEMSARYAPLPAVDYLPTAERCLSINGANKQANAVAGAAELTHETALAWLEKLAAYYAQGETLYQEGLSAGVPKELARLPLTVGRFSRMRASTNLRNWLAFLTLRSDVLPSGKAAQWEIRQYANAVAAAIAERFPRTYELFAGRA